MSVLLQRQFSRLADLKGHTMTDIVDRLRAGEPCSEAGDRCKVMNGPSGCLCAIAADEIARLNTALAASEGREKQLAEGASNTQRALIKGHHEDMATARNDALDEAALWHEYEIMNLRQQMIANNEYRLRSGDTDHSADDNCRAAIRGHTTAAKSIRSLKDIT